MANGARRGRTIRRVAVRAAAACAGLTLVAAAAAVPVEAVPTPAASPAQYVALGDSYTAAPGVLPLASGAPLDCLQSSRNYPHVTAATLGLTLVDRSCSGATTADMATAQYPDQPPQFAALRRSTSVVTIGIGGNDHQLFLSAVALCSITDILDVVDIGSPCQSLFGSYFVNLVNSDGPTVGRAIAAIHVRSPAAKVLVVGYPDILPQQGNCYPQLPLTSGDVAYLNTLELAINAMVRREALAHGAIPVDTYTASIGHDACKPVGTRWIEPVIPGTDAFPIHPNALGEAADALQVMATLGIARVKAR